MMRKHKEVLLLLFSAVFTVANSVSNITLTTKKGPIIGLRFAPNPVTQVSYDAFIGIPYGNKPARFQLAEPRSNWTAPLVTQNDGPACPQLDMPFSEDCLYLNVYTPVNASKNASKFPVMAFIHGSAFTVSSSSSKQYGPDFLVAANVILVTMNYRLGAAGFLTLGSKVAPGNLGLHDTVLALQWIQDEISVFGGDPRQVTLWGQSAGSVMTQFHFLSPISAGLFSKAIAQSGSAVADWGLVTPAEGTGRAKLLASALGCDSTQHEPVILSCLQNADINHIVGNQSIALPISYSVPGNGLPFVPVLDTYQTAYKPFFGNSVENLMKIALNRSKPMITGFTADEGILMFSKTCWTQAQDNLASFIPQNGNKNLMSEIRSRYFPDTPDLNKVESLVSLYTDSAFAYPSVQMSRYFANMTYGYHFTYDGSWAPPASYFARYKMKGVNHGDDLQYLFYSSNSSQYLDTCASNLPNVLMMLQMVEWWTNFAKTGIPDSSWQKVSSGEYLIIDSTLNKMNTSTFENQFYNFWAGIHSATSSTITVKFSVLALYIVVFCFITAHL